MDTRLTVELVRSTCWYTNVRSRVPKAVWDRLRRQVAAQAGNRCEICGGRGRRWPVECHELWHYDDDRKIQRLERLAALCPACHEVKHAGSPRSDDCGYQGLNVCGVADPRRNSDLGT